MATSAREAKRRVYTMLRNSMAALNPAIEVSNGGVRTPGRSWVFTSKVVYSDAHFAAIGGRKRDEDYDVTVIFSFVSPGGSTDDAEDSTLAAVDAFETALRADPTLGGLAAKGAQLYPKEFQSQPNTEGAICEWQGAVRITGARI